MALLITLALAGAARSQSDIEADFRRQVSAVLGADGSDGVLLIQPGGPSRRLKVGEIWRDGWRLAELTSYSATLRRGADEARIDLRIWPHETASATLDAEPVVLTNARSTLDAAVVAGDLDTVLRGGGTPAQIRAALRVTMGAATNPAAAQLVDRFVNLADGSRLLPEFGDTGTSLVRLGPNGMPNMVLSNDHRSIRTVGPGGVLQ